MFGFISLLAPPSTDTADRSISAVCSQLVIMPCNGSGNPEPNISWAFTPLVTSQPSIFKAPTSTSLGWKKYQSILTLYNVRGGKCGNEGTYQCIINNTIGESRKVNFILSITCKYPIMKISLITQRLSCMKVCLILLA